MRRMKRTITHQVLDAHPRLWDVGATPSVSSAMAGDICGLSSKLELVQPHDPQVVCVGVIVAIRCGSEWESIFTDGDTYRRLRIEDGEGEGLQVLNQADAKIIRAAITSKYGEELA